MVKKTIEEKYLEMSEVEHILHRPSMYVGSIKEEENQLFLYNDTEAKMTLQDVNYVPAMLKIFDEVLSNSCDEYRRSTNLGLNEIDVTIYKNGEIIVKDNGGIPVAIHKEAKCYVPEFIFGRLRTSSNYDDTEDRQLIGTNGVGSALTNVFSSKFMIETCDKKNKFQRSWENNMQKLNDDLKITPCKDHYTQTTFKVDFSKFDIAKNEFTDDFISLAHKRCIDAAVANIGLKVNFRYIDGKETKIKSSWKFKKFEEYIDLYSDFVDVKNMLSFEDTNKKVWIFPDGNGGDVAFVDGAECSKGTHIKGVRSFINSSVATFLTNKHKMDMTAKAVDNKYTVFGIFNVSNPSYTSQTKEELTTPIDKFSKEEGFEFTVPDKFLMNVNKSELIGLMLDWYKQKLAAEDQRVIRQLNKQAGKGLKRPDKYITCSSKHKGERQLWIFEGDSAKAGFRSGRNPEIQAGYTMRGVPLNCLGMTPIQIMKNEVFSDLISILGLKWGKEFEMSQLTYSKIVISSDADVDGDKIAALLMLFFNNWPQLFEKHILCRSISPIIVAKKGKDERKYYKIENYKVDEKKLKNYEIKYTKGLAGLNAAQSKEMYQSPIFHYYEKDNLTDKMFKKWFSKDTSNERKTMLTE